jgi:hypothetical protein
MNFSLGKNKIWLFAALAFYLPICQAEIYKQVDKQGRVTYSNVPLKGAKKLDLEPLGSFPAPPGKSKTSPAPQGAAPQGTPNKVDVETQKKRDDVRRKILEQELADEEKLLTQAKQEYNSGEPERLGDEKHNYQKYLDRVEKLKETVALHERNVAALKQELTTVR